MHKVILHKNAAKYYRNADKKLQGWINTAVDTISENPRYHVHIKKLEGELKDMYRYRLGNLRILYEIHEDLKTIRIKAGKGLRLQVATIGQFEFPSELRLNFGERF